MEVLNGKEAVLCEGVLSLSDPCFQVDGFSLKAYHELESFFEKPEPYLELELSSAAVIAFIGSSNNVLLIETVNDSEVRRIELPAGKVNDEDESIYDTARREFIEETGLRINDTELEPLLPRHQKDIKGGLQFLTEINPRFFRELSKIDVDDLGRIYFKPPVGTDRGRTISLIVEPLEVFVDQDRSLLRYTRHGWAVDNYVIATLLLIGIKRARRINDIQQQEVLESILMEKNGWAIDRVIQSIPLKVKGPF
jgi:8-oxo-dGTP pyrophosphatase MutT (NUDIX family)